MVFSYVTIISDQYTKTFILIDELLSKNNHEKKRTKLAKSEKLKHVKHANQLKAQLAIIYETLKASQFTDSIERIRQNIGLIAYVKSLGRFCSVHDETGNQLFDVNVPLKTILSIFNEDFVQCAKSYIVIQQQIEKSIKAGRNSEV